MYYGLPVGCIGAVWSRDMEDNDHHQQHMARP